MVGVKEIQVQESVFKRYCLKWDVSI